MSDDFQQEIDNILADNGKIKKKKHSGNKGSRAERELCKKLSERFGQPFERSVGSGNRIAQVKGMTEAAKQTLLGDISVPDKFAWVLESKCGYEDKVDIHNVWIKGNKTIDSFIEQVVGDSVNAGRKPMLFYKRNLRPWIAFFRTADRPHQAGPLGNLPVEFDYSLNYREWMGVSLDVLLEKETLRSPINMDFWFK
jgi:hypothetical protein